MVYSPLLTGGLSQPLMRLVVDENPSKSDDVHDQWLIRNVPRTAKLSVKIFDKDNDKVKDDYIAGEMHPRPICGWDRFTSAIQVDCDQWELVIGNGSSTYPPDRSLLVKLKD
ncbi:unnamed protein product [Rotaria socialis]|uniref:Uncharacterized protein n=1 Tax=Rotaria socialis TaxID=392032 RepID=A0A818YCM9_9BILA|nr:unnamed protein product [Rotaria socialis]